MAWSKEPGAQRDLPPGWWSIVKRIKKRDKDRCTWRLPSGKRCPRKGTEVDHIDDPEDHGDANLRLLCTHHHKRRTGEQALAARTGPKLEPRTETHPGRLR